MTAMPGQPAGHRAKFLRGVHWHEKSEDSVRGGPQKRRPRRTRDHRFVWSKDLDKRGYRVDATPEARDQRHRLRRWLRYPPRNYRSVNKFRLGATFHRDGDVSAPRKQRSKKPGDVAALIPCRRDYTSDHPPIGPPCEKGVDHRRPVHNSSHHRFPISG